MKTDSLLRELGRSLRSPDSLSFKGLLETKKSFSFTLFVLALLLAGLINLTPTVLPLEWSLSAYPLLFKEFIFACALGRLIYHFSLSLRKHTKQMSHESRGWRAPLCVYLFSLLGGVLDWPVVITLLTGSLTALMFMWLSRLHWKNNEFVSLTLVLLLGLYISLASETLALLLWHELLADNLTVLTPSSFFDSLFVGFLLPLPIVLGAPLYFCIDQFGWNAAGVFCLASIGTFLSSRWSMSIHLNTLKRPIPGLRATLLTSTTLLFLIVLSQYPEQLGWSALSFFLTLLTFALSLLKWRFWPCLSLGVLVFCVQFFLDWLSSGVIDGT